MKYLLGALLAANCLYFATAALWPQQHLEPPPVPAPLKVPAVKLLSEMAHVEVIEPVADEAVPTAPPTSAADFCLVSSPVADRAAAEALLAAMRSDDIGARIVEVEAADSDHLVYIPAPESRAEARRTCAELSDKGIECHMIPTGARAGDLSVGVFSRREGADRQRARVAKLGFDTRIAPLSPLVYRLVSSAVPKATPPAALDWSPCPAIADLGSLL